MALTIKWDKNAISQFLKAIEYIEEISPANAENVRRDILLLIDGLLTHPEKYHPDKFKSKNDGTFRAFELHKLRISYRVSETAIRILRIRHTKMNPKLLRD